MKTFRPSDPAGWKYMAEAWKQADKEAEDLRLVELMSDGSSVTVPWDVGEFMWTGSQWREKRT